MFDSSTIYRKFKNSYVKNYPEYIAFRKKHYPEFVYEKHLQTLRNEIPIFTLHSADPNGFEKILQFLYRNSYQTLTADQLYECIIGNMPVPDRTIVLTFDDGWESTWTVAYPLLKKYKYQAVCFIIPGLISEEISCNGNIEDFGNGETFSKEIEDGKRTSENLCTWQAIQRMHDAGTIDFQSHTMYHTLIFTSPVIEDFVHPSFDYYHKNFNVPISSNNGTDNISRKAEFGTPIYQNAPRFSGKRRYYDDVELRNECIKYVRDNGGEKYFNHSNWRKKLLFVVEGHQKKYNDTAHFESEEEQRENIYKDLKESKRTIECKLRGKTVSHLCYPWWKGCDLSIELSKKAGYLTNFWGIVAESRTSNRRGTNPFRIGRLLGDEFIYRLPGEGRKSLREIFKEKVLHQYKGFIKRLL